MRLSWWLVVAALALPPIGAGASPLRIEVEGACSTETIERQLRELTSEAPTQDAAPRVRVTVSTSEGGLIASVLAVDPDGTEHGPRTLEAESCAELETALAVVIAALSRAPREDATAPTPQATVAPAPSSSAEVVGAAREEASLAKPPLGFALVLGASGATSTNGISGEALLGMTIRRTHSLEVAVRTRLPEQLDVAAGAGHVRISTLAFELAPCAHLRRFAACGTLGLGWVAASAAGLADQRPAHLATALLGARLVGEQPISARFALRARIDVRAALARARVLVDEMPVWASPAAEATAGIDIVALFP